MSVRESLAWSVVWIGVALAFNYGFYQYAAARFGPDNTSFVDPDCRVLEFNAGGPSAARFDAIHFAIEPHGFMAAPDGDGIAVWSSIQHPNWLQKVLADAGVASRRECEALIIEGAVTVNGKTIDTLPAWADPANDRIEVYGRPVPR